MNITLPYIKSDKASHLYDISNLLYVCEKKNLSYQENGVGQTYTSFDG